MVLKYMFWEDSGIIDV